MTPWLLVPSLVALLAWVILLLGRGGFWRFAERLEGPPGELPAWPEVVAVVPARNEAELVEEAVSSLLCQDYPGRLTVILADDHSEDGTAEAAQKAAMKCRRSDDGGRRFLVQPVKALPAGWRGKLWALEEARRAALRLAPEASLLWLSDADIAHEPDNLRRLVAVLEQERRDLVSQMVRLSTAGFWEALLIPAFVYFFALLYPFAWVADPQRRTAAAAGGCVLLRRAALEKAGGFEAIRGALIDDCALARAVKDSGGALRLGHSRKASSLRRYEGLKGLWDMVARSAYTQLRHSPLLLLATLLGIGLIFLWPAVVVLSWPLHGDNFSFLVGLITWLIISSSSVSSQTFYNLSPSRAVLLPLVAFLYLSMTLDSAWRHWRGHGAHWKGRTASDPLAPPALGD